MEKRALFDYCVALSGSSLISERQIEWSGRWTLMGDFVVCSECYVAQPIDMASQSFEHSPGCLANQYGRQPWFELIDVLSQIPRTPEPQVH